MLPLSLSLSPSLPPDGFATVTATGRRNGVCGEEGVGGGEGWGGVGRGVGRGRNRRGETDSRRVKPPKPAVRASGRAVEKGRAEPERAGRSPAGGEARRSPAASG